MADFTVFYSWQSDLPRKLTRDIVHGAASRAMERLNFDASVEDAPRLDHDTQGVAGAPEIAGTILRKIEQCGVFLADLTFVATTTPADVNKVAKRIPNPNVLLELGYAAAKIGWERIVLVMNSAYGDPDELIFDLRHRRFPLTFNLGPETRRDAEAVEWTLSEKMEEALRAALQAEHAAVQEAIGQLDQHALVWLNDRGRDDYFAPLPRKTMGEILGSQRLDDALIRLIHLKLLRCDVAPGRNLYAYHWTYLGKLVLKAMGIRPKSVRHDNLSQAEQSHALEPAAGPVSNGKSSPPAQ